MSEQDKTHQEVESVETGSTETGQAEVSTGPAKAAESARAPAQGSGGGAVLAVFLSLVAIGIASYPAYVTWQAAQNVAPNPLDEKVSAVSLEMARLTTRQGDINNRLDVLAQQTDSGQGYVDKQVELLRLKIGAELNLVREQFGTSSQDWLYAEVEYLVRMANQRALMESDVASALQLLTSADDIIRAADGLTAHGLREALAHDIAALKAVNEPDVQGIFLTLSALVNQVQTLKRDLPAFDTPKRMVPDAATDTGWVNRIGQMLAGAGHRLSELVDFRRGDIEIKPILPPAEEYYLRQNLVLKLQLAQLALLEGNNELFRQSISEASLWLTDYFDQGDTTTSAMSQTLAALVDAEISVTVPDITQSLAAVRRQLESFKGEAVR